MRRLAPVAALIALVASCVEATSDDDEGKGGSSTKGDASAGSSGRGASGGASGSGGGTGGGIGSGGTLGSGGVNGSGGASGVSGTNGSSGTKGAAGASGSGGAAGSNGAAGKAGASGSAGAGGKAGASGSAGAGGKAGASGSAGAPSDAGADAGSRPCPGPKPDATNTGPPAGLSLTVVNQDVTVTASNTVIDAQDIRGFLIIQASNVRVTRSIVRGRATTATTSIIRVNSGTGIVIEDTEIAAAQPSVGVDGLSGSNFTARRLHIHGGVDGMKMGSNSSIECSYIHDLRSFASDPSQGGGPTHNDAIQILSGSNIRVIGNQLLAATSQNAAIQVTQDFGAVSNLNIENNWADGGGCTFNFSHNGGSSLTVNTRNNRFGRSSYFNCPILRSLSTTLNSTGDVWDDTGMPVPVQAHN